MRTVEHAYKLLDWHENLSEDEIPPRWMWTVDHELDKWFEAVDTKRKAKYGGNASPEDEDGGPMMTNSLVEEMTDG